MKGRIWVLEKPESTTMQWPVRAAAVCCSTLAGGGGEGGGGGGG